MEKKTPIRTASSRIGLGLVRVVRNAAAFSIFLALTGLLINRSLPIPSIPTVQAKLERIKEAPDKYNTLFIGSSRIYRQIAPHLFDQLAADRGLATISFNAGVDGMRAPEDGFFFDQILKLHPKGLRWIFVELNELRLPVNRRQRGSSRAVYWHDWPRMVLLFREALAARKSTSPSGIYRELQLPIGDFREHLGLFVQNMSNLGESAPLMEALFHPHRRRIYRAPLGAEEDGFLEVPNWHGMSPQTRVIYERALEGRLRNQRVTPSDFGSAPSQDALWGMIDKIEALGATPILLIAPTTAPKNFAPKPRNGRSPLVFDFSNLDEYADLYEEQYRMDGEHLNTAGAEIFTRHICARFAQLAKP